MNDAAPAEVTEAQEKAARRAAKAAKRAAKKEKAAGLAPRPEQLASQAKANAARAAREAQRQLTEARVVEFDLRFMHIRATDVEGNMLSNGGVTLAFSNYGPPRSRKGLVLVAQAIVSKKDGYCKEKGRDQAAEHFSRGEAIVVQVPKGAQGVTSFLGCMFGLQVFEEVSDML